MVRYSIKHGYPVMIGDGLAVWNQVHIKDLARGYVTLLHWLEESLASTVAENPYFFCENSEELSWREYAAEIGRILYSAGKENYGDLFGEYSVLVIGSNARNQASRLRKIGWEAREKKTFASLAEDEIPQILLETAPVASGKFDGNKVEIML
ncbi:hypothetical protein AtubIFM54640_011261 [Aspergillus tubingensis]|nr:hypothetical protein AtubIFM54640_011261 [Aspergillus tubingensis]